MARPRAPLAALRAAPRCALLMRSSRPGGGAIEKKAKVERNNAELSLRVQTRDCRANCNSVRQPRVVRDTVLRERGS